MNWNKYLAVTLFVVLSCTSDDPNTPEQAPLPPTNLTTEAVSENQINLTWTDNSTNEKGFKIERKISPGSYSEVGTVDVDLTTYNDTGLTPNTTYTYRIYSFNDGGKSITYSNESEATTNSIPTLSTSAITSITYESASSGGSITIEGSSTISAKGIVWDINPNPTIALTTKTNDGTGIGEFSSTIENLLPETKYYVRAYATNGSGTGYGDELNFTTLELPPLAGDYSFISATLRKDITIDGTTIPAGTDISAEIGEGLFGVVTCTNPDNTTMRLANDDKLYFLCLNEPAVTPVQAGIWTGTENNTNIVLALSSPPYPSPISATIKGVSINGNTMSGYIQNLPIPGATFGDPGTAFVLTDFDIVFEKQP